MMRGVVGLATLCGCADGPPRPGADGGTDAGSDVSSDRQAVPVGPATYRVCGSAVRDPEGGFCDVTARWGMEARTELPERMSVARGGVTAADFDGDGRTDLFVSRATTLPPALLLHRAEGWVESAAAWGLGDLRRVLPSAAADLDGDGDQDLVVAFLNEGPVQVFRNEGTRFVDAGTLGAPEEIAAVVPGDVDRDGRLDLLVAALSYGGSCPPGLVRGCPAGVRAYRQVAPWRFEPVRVDAPARRAQAVRLMDLDGDGRDELLVVTDFGMIDGGNQVLRVDPLSGGGFSLRDATAGTGFDQQVFGMGLGLIDVDGDGRDELLVTNLGRNALISGGIDRASALGADAYGVLFPDVRPSFRAFDSEHAVEGPLGRFQSRYLDQSSASMPTTKWTPVVFDADDDGISDVYIPAGAIGLGDMYPEATAQQGALLRGTGRDLVDVTVAMHASEPHDESAALAADLDGDLDLDLAVVHMARPGAPGGLTVLRNDASAGASLTVVARGRGAARDGVGALVSVRVGARRSHQRLDGNLSIFGSAPHEAHFGLGGASLADEVTVQFPSGATVRRQRVPAGRVVVEE